MVGELPFSAAPSLTHRAPPAWSREQRHLQLSICRECTAIELVISSGINHASSFDRPTDRTTCSTGNLNLLLPHEHGPTTRLLNTPPSARSATLQPCGYSESPILRITGESRQGCQSPANLSQFACFPQSREGGRERVPRISIIKINRVPTMQLECSTEGFHLNGWSFDWP